MLHRPTRAASSAGSQRASGVIAAGHTTTPPSRTGLSKSTSVEVRNPRRLSSARAWVATCGVTTPCQVTRTLRSSGERLPSALCALRSPAITPSAATAPPNATASAIPTAGASHRAGLRRARAATSVRGAMTPRTLTPNPADVDSAHAPSPAPRTPTSSTTAPTGCASGRRRPTRNARRGTPSSVPSCHRTSLWPSQRGPRQ